MPDGTPGYKSGQWRADRRLESWKEIATYLGREVRTIQRWEKSDGLPIHRLYHAKRGTVYAFTQELDAWWESRRNLLTEAPEELTAPAPAETEPEEQPTLDPTQKSLVSEKPAAEEPTPNPAPRRPLHQRRLFIAAIGALILLAGVAGWLLRDRFDRGGPRVTRVTSFPGDEEIPDLSPDGRQAAFSWNGLDGKNYDIYVTRLDHGGLKRITTAAEWDFSPAWSPQGDQIAFLRVAGDSSLDILTVSPDGGRERKVARVTSVGANLTVKRRGVIWTPDGKWLIVCGSDSQETEGLLLVPLAGGPVRRLTLPAKGQYDLEPALTPGGKLLAFRRETGFSVSGLYSLELTDGYGPAGPERQIEAEAAVRVGSPQWESPNSLLYIAHDRVMRAALDERHVARQAPREAVPQQPGCRLVAISYRPSKADRLLTSCTTDEATIWRLDLRSPAGQASRLSRVAGSQSDMGVTLSPDGRQIAFESEREGSSAIWVANVNGGSARKVAAAAGSPSWSPDGQWIAFDSTREGRPNVYVMRPDGSSVRRLTHSLAEANLPQWSGDGKWIYFACRYDARFEVARMPADGGEPLRVTRGGGTVAGESRDGRSIYYVRRGKDAWSLRQCALDGANDHDVVTQLTYRAFAVADDGVYFIPLPGADGRSSINFLNFTTGAITMLTSIQRPQLKPLALSLDQRFLLFSQFDHWGRDLVMLDLRR